MEKILAAVLLFFILGCAGQTPSARKEASWVVLYESGQIVGVWRAIEVVRLGASRIEFIDERNMNYMVISGTFSVTPCAESKSVFDYSRLEL